MKLNEVWLAVSSTLFPTTRVTGMFKGELPAVEVTVTVEVYVPGANAASVVGLIEKFSVCGVDPVEGVTVTKFPPLPGATDALKVSGLPELSNCTCCCDGRVEL